MNETFENAPETKRPGGFLNLEDDDICQRASKRFSRVSLALLCMIVLGNVVAILVGTILGVLFPNDPSIRTAPLVRLMLSFLPLYLVGVPVAWLIMRPMPARAPKAGKISGGHLVVLFIVSIFFMQAGNLIGSGLSSILTHGQAQNVLSQLVGMEGWLQFVVIVLIGPIIEELVFRKLIIDRVNRFGEKAAILFSALCFALFHTNLFQLFYAFGLGLVFGYIYVRTGKLRITIIFHIIVNAMGSLAPMLVMQTVQNALGMPIEEIAALTPEQMVSKMGALLPLFLWSLVVFGLAIAGLILLIIFAKKVHFEPAKDQLPKGKAFKAVCLNVGFILYFLACMGLMVYVLLI